MKVLCVVVALAVLAACTDGVSVHTGKHVNRERDLVGNQAKVAGVKDGSYLERHDTDLAPVPPASVAKETESGMDSGKMNAFLGVNNPTASATAAAHSTGSSTASGSATAAATKAPAPSASAAPAASASATPAPKTAAPAPPPKAKATAAPSGKTAAWVDDSGIVRTNNGPVAVNPTGPSLAANPALAQAPKEHTTETKHQQSAVGSSAWADPSTIKSSSRLGTPDLAHHQVHLKQMAQQWKKQLLGEPDVIHHLTGFDKAETTNMNRLMEKVVRENLDGIPVSATNKMIDAGYNATRAEVVAKLGNAARRYNRDIHLSKHIAASASLKTAAHLASAPDAVADGLNKMTKAEEMDDPLHEAQNAEAEDKNQTSTHKTAAHSTATSPATHPFAYLHPLMHPYYAANPYYASAYSTWAPHINALHQHAAAVYHAHQRAHANLIAAMKAHDGLTKQMEDDSMVDPSSKNAKDDGSKLTADLLPKNVTNPHHGKLSGSGDPYNDHAATLRSLGAHPEQTAPKKESAANKAALKKKGAASGAAQFGYPYGPMYPSPYAAGYDPTKYNPYKLQAQAYAAHAKHVSKMMKKWKRSHRQYKKVRRAFIRTYNKFVRRMRRKYGKSQAVRGMLEQLTARVSSSLAINTRSMNWSM